MKKTFPVSLMLVSLVLLSSGAAFARTAIVKGGFCLANFRSFNLDGSPKSKFGLVGGVGLTVGGPQIGFEIDALYMQKGCRNDSGRMGQYDFDLPVISVPAMIKLRLSGKQTAPFIVFGGEVGYVLKASMNGTAGFAEWPIPDGVKRWDFGVVGGAGIEIEMEALSLVLEGRYSLGLTDVSNHAQLQFKTSALYVLAGLLF